MLLVQSRAANMHLKVTILKFSTRKKKRGGGGVGKSDAFKMSFRQFNSFGFTRACISSRMFTRVFMLLYIFPPGDIYNKVYPEAVALKCDLNCLVLAEFCLSNDHIYGSNYLL